MIRVGVVGYRNAIPLAHGLDAEDGLRVRRGVPAEIADGLDRGELDVGLVPVAALADHPEWGVVPNLGIAAEGEVTSVALFLGRPLDEIETIALDPASRTSNVLARLWLRHRLGREVAVVSGAADLSRRLSEADAAVGIGDAALDHPAGDPERIDLAGAWTEWTGLPFVFAVWAGPRAGVPGLAERLSARLEANLASLDAVLAETVPAGERPAVRRYLTRHIRHRLGEAEERGLRAFFERAARAGLLSPVPDVSCHGIG